MSLSWVVGFSFLAGMVGYIIVRFWIIPIVRYRRAKRQLLERLTRYWRVLPTDDGAKLKGSVGKKGIREIRRWGMRLLELHNDELPYWYRLVLLSRKESPEAATEPLLRLENMPTGGQARECIRQVGRHLALKTFDHP